jgi:peptide deformylase
VVRRDLYNAGSEPVTRYLARVAVDRYPGEPERSNRYYRDHPLTWVELNIDARSGDEPMRITPKYDRDAAKEFWLLFENDEARFPLYPGQRATIEYAYSVGEDKWGHWFQRAIRLPTRRVSVHMEFPSELSPVVWGVESTLTTEGGPLRTPVREHPDSGRAVFDWSIEDPPLNARYRLEWRFRANGGTRSAKPGGARAARPSELMQSAGVLQRGASVLDRTARSFDLPAQAVLAGEVVGRLLDGLNRVRGLHEFRKGLGIAAPQLGIGWAAAVLQGPTGAPVVLLNPQVVGESVECDEQYEGCLSFFDVRGLVSRPLILEVQHTDLTGGRIVSRFTHAQARLAAHEIDHLVGMLYTDRMSGDARPIPVEEYQQHGQPWVYAG